MSCRGSEQWDLGRGLTRGPSPQQPASESAEVEDTERGADRVCASEGLEELEVTVHPARPSVRRQFQSPPACRWQPPSTLWCGHPELMEGTRPLAIYFLPQPGGLSRAQPPPSPTPHLFLAPGKAGSSGNLPCLGCRARGWGAQAFHHFSQCQAMPPQARGQVWGHMLRWSLPHPCPLSQDQHAQGTHGPHARLRLGVRVP